MGSALGILSALGTGLSVAGSVVGGYQQAKAAKEESRIANMNAATAQADAANSAAAQREAYRRLGATQKSEMGATGFDVDSDSALSLLAQTDAEGELAAMELLYGGNMEAYNWSQQAKSAQKKSKSAILSGYMGGVSALAGSLQNISYPTSTPKKPVLGD